jgi:hypothetical protein
VAPAWHEAVVPLKYGAAVPLWHGEEVAMIEAEVVRPLLEGLATDDDPVHQRLLVETLTALPLSPAAWRSAAPRVAPAARALLQPHRLDLPTCELLARVPLRSVRSGLRRLAGDPAAPRALEAALGLAQVGDAAGLAVLLQALAREPGAAVARALAGLPLEHLGVKAADLAPGLVGATGGVIEGAPGAAAVEPAAEAEAGDAMLPLWTAIAQARCGELEPLEQLWDVLVRPPHRVRRPGLFRAPPPLFTGDPALAVAELARLQPLPARVRQFVLGLKDHDYDTGWAPRPQRGAGPAREARLLVAGLAGMPDSAGGPAAAPASSPPVAGAGAGSSAAAVLLAQRLLHTPWRGLEPALQPHEHALLRQLPADLSAQVAEAAIDALARDAALLRSTPPLRVGQALVDLAGALPAPLPLHVAGVLMTPAATALPAQALAWTLARAGAGPAVQALAPHIAGSRGQERTGWLGWLARIAAQLDAPPARGMAGLPVPRRPAALVDDPGPRARPPGRGLEAKTGLGFGAGAAAGREADARPPRRDADTVPEIGIPGQGATPPAESRQGPVSAGRGEAVSDRVFPPEAAPGAEPEAVPGWTPAPRAIAAPAPPTATRTVYPDLAADDLHPLAGAMVRFSVSLALQPVRQTRGSVQLPDTAPELEHELKVHLLFGGRSAWSVLRFSAARGTLQAAQFELPAPDVEAERALVEARVNFYLNQRWCGEGQRHLDVRRDAAVAPLAAIPFPAVPPWRQALKLDPAAQPPDLIVRIQKGAAAGEYLWSCLSPHLELAPPALPRDACMSLGDDAATFVRRTFAPLANQALDQLRIGDVGGAGEKIYRSTPAHFRDSYWVLWHAAAQGGFVFDSIQIVTDEPCVPWELMRLYDRERAPQVPAEFLAVRHSVGRWLAGESSTMTQRIRVQRLAVAASDYAGIREVGSPLPWAARERELLVGTYRAEAVALRSDAVLRFLTGGSVQAAHFACHGRMSITDPDASLLVMEDTPRDLTPLSVARSEVCEGLGRQHPLVFLNACEVGGSAASLSLVAGFPAAFLYAGAAALVSPLWAVNDERAHRIAEQFYRQVLAAGGGQPLGAALRDVRRRWKDEAHLTFLAYVLYGDPLARVSYEPAAPAAGDAVQDTAAAAAH